MWLPAAETTAKEVCASGGCQSPQPWGFALGVLSTNHDFVLDIVKEEPQYNKNPVVMVDEVMSSSPPKFTFLPVPTCGYQPKTSLSLILQGLYRGYIV